MSHLTEYGFTFGPMEVTRLVEIDGYATLEVKSDHHKMQISCSPAGRSLRVWKDGTELTTNSRE